jgi:hypothetical protein
MDDPHSYQHFLVQGFPGLPRLKTPEGGLSLPAPD